MNQYDTLEPASAAYAEPIHDEPVHYGNSGKRRTKLWLGTAAGIALLVVAGKVGVGFFGADGPPAPPPPKVSVSQPLKRDIEQRLSFLGQFAAIRQVEIRAQVGGTLTAVAFKDGDVVRQGQLLFQIDPVPYRIKVDQARAELASANARLNLATRELARAQQLKLTDAGSAQNVDQRVAEKAVAAAAVSGAQATLRDAMFDLGRTRVYAPFTGRIGTHLVSAGNLISGSRAASSPTTLLTTLVSLDPVWINFDMSEADYAAFQKQRASAQGPLANKVEVSTGGDSGYGRTGVLDFIDNAIDRGSGTIHARATLENGSANLTPGAFGRVRLAVSAPAPALLVTDAAVLSDQGDHNVYVLGKDNLVSAKKVTIGELRGGLRIVTSGLAPTDKVVIDGIPSVRPGAPVNPEAGTIRFGSDQD